MITMSNLKTHLHADNKYEEEKQYTVAMPHVPITSARDS